MYKVNMPKKKAKASMAQPETPVPWKTSVEENAGLLSMLVSWIEPLSVPLLVAAVALDADFCFCVCASARFMHS